MVSRRLLGGWLLTRAHSQALASSAEVVTKQQKIEVVRTNMENLRQEATGWMQSQSSLWRTAIAGIAAVLVLDRDVDLVRFLPLIPTLGMALLLQWLAQTFMVFRIGRALAVEETRINSWLGDPVALSHERTLWGERQRLLRGEKNRGRPFLYAAAIIVPVASHLGLVGWALDHQNLEAVPGAEPFYWATAVVIDVLAAIMFVRLCRLVQRELPNASNVDEAPSSRA
jgi:hypothetical protein